MFFKYILLLLFLQCYAIAEKELNNTAQLELNPTKEEKQISNFPGS